MNPSLVNFLSRHDLIEINEYLFEMLGYEYDYEKAQDQSREQLLKDLNKCVGQVGHQTYMDVCMGMLQSRLGH